MQIQFASLIAKHWWQLAIAAYVAWSTFVDSLEEPKPTDGPAYKSFYRFAHALAGNLFTAVAKFGRTPWPGQTPAARFGALNSPGQK